MGDPFPSPPPVVRAFRESFGDRKLPDISRKITACVACRKQKVKCHMKDGEVPCSRCKKRGLSCTVNRSLQILLEDDVTSRGEAMNTEYVGRWKEVMSQKIQQLMWRSSNTKGKLIPPAVKRCVHHEFDIITTPTSEMAGCDGFSRRPRINSCLMCIGATNNSFIGQYASFALESYHWDKLSPYLISITYALIIFYIKYSEISPASTLFANDRHFSRLPSAPLERCTPPTAITLSTTSNVDDVRGLCIGAFWLHELPWALIGTAVRIASDLKLHHGIYRALKGDREGYLQARLYYLVYVCAHHFSVAYSRPSMSREKLIHGLLPAMCLTCGVDVETPIPLQCLPQLRRYSIELDIWYADWNETFRPHRNVGNYPQKGVGMHWNFAKLYLCSHAFRGVSTVQERSQSLPPELEEIANMGVLSAMSILNVIVSDDERRSFLHGLPLYFDTMIAFAVVFLLKVATKYTDTIRIDTDKILFLVSHTVAALNEITHYMHPQHLLVAIAEGLQKLLWKCQEQSRITQEPMQQLPATLEHSPTEMAWMESITNFDFLTSVPNVDDWVFHYPVATGAHPTHYNP
ncbi:conserved hypothetical protein [Talaromyces marneffei ATCC 18224]|uniref:Zn(2)-C6 fungal-type domain-containing protein n=1 Tax=Talaromyces marneffei (strain ATCC 18224 / CBS 334.59 / QM 7333) TaxID=441960 RepID=B6QFL4_TALMQ|nr:conserved hypothetical protein [Talaromyces marneffei ATCC 18224]